MRYSNLCRVSLFLNVNFLLESVRDVSKGFNSTIFAYGQTGSGKTFTMFGPHWDDNQHGRQNTFGGMGPEGSFLSDKQQYGVIPRTID